MCWMCLQPRRGQLTTNNEHTKREQLQRTTPTTTTTMTTMMAIVKGCEERVCGGW